jgi:hypothetical protein
MKTISLFNVLIGLGLSFFLAGCASGGDNVTKMLGEEVSLRPMESAYVGSESFFLRFEEVVSDSRCPSDVVCIRAGEAVVRVSAGASRDSYTFAVPSWSSAEHPHNHVIDGYQVELLSVQPHPRSDEAINPADYIANFVVTANE